MRQIGNLTNEALAERFVDYLTTREISALSEADDGNWIVWVHDENAVDEAREELGQFKEDPNAERYRRARGEAVERRAAEVKRRREGKKNVVQVRGQWDAPLSKRAPLVLALIAISVGVGIFSGFTLSSPGQAPQRWLFFADVTTTQAETDAFASIRQGQIWRLVTPMFLHGDLIHLAFNMFWLYYLGGQVEAKRGTTRLAGIVGFTSLLSNVIQAWVGGPWFGGMSGVVFGLFGYVWVRRKDGYLLSQTTILIVMIFFALGFTGMLDRNGAGIANWAHAAGLVAGAALGYLPELWPRKPGRPSS